MICCFTGHRLISDEHILKLPELLDREIERLIVGGVTVFRGGGALGFDTLAELKVLEKRNKYKNIRLELILPCRDQADKWSKRNKEIYEYILSKADKVEYISDTYTRYCMHERNRRLVKDSDVCVAYCCRNRGGTLYTVTHAIKQGLEVINLADALLD